MDIVRKDKGSGTTIYEGRISWDRILSFVVVLVVADKCTYRIINQSNLQKTYKKDYILCNHTFFFFLFFLLFLSLLVKKKNDCR